MSLVQEAGLITLVRSDFSNSKLLAPVVGVLKRSYIKYGFWLGDEHFEAITKPNVTHIQYLNVKDGSVAAATLYNGNRMLMIGVEPSLQGTPYAQILLEEALKSNPETWMTGSVVKDAHSMIALLSKPKFGLQLVENLDEIQDLFQSSKGFIVGDKFDDDMIEHPILKRNLGRERFFAFTHSESVHGSDYGQFAFRVPLLG